MNCYAIDPRIGKQQPWRCKTRLGKLRKRGRALGACQNSCASLKMTSTTKEGDRTRNFTYVTVMDWVHIPAVNKLTVPEVAQHSYFVHCHEFGA